VILPNLYRHLLVLAEGLKEIRQSESRHPAAVLDRWPSRDGYFSRRDRHTSGSMAAEFTVLPVVQSQEFYLLRQTQGFVRPILGLFRTGSPSS
jgi:hypothetical protein